MRAVLITLQVVAPLAAIAMLYRVVVRPWLRGRNVTADGLICLSFLLMVIQDPLENFSSQYLTYNAYMVNFGSWVSDVPAWQSYGRPGAMLVEPIIFNPANYVVAPLLTMMAGCKALDWMRARWPHAGNARLFATLLAGMLVCWPVVEGGIYMPLGVFTFAGGTVSLFPDAYHKYPLWQALWASVFMAAFTAFRYLTDEHGRTLAERGLGSLGLGVRRTILVRFLAVLGVCNVLYLATYNLPLAIFTHMDTGSWPAEVQSHSYFTDHLCGDQTTRACPGSSSPLAVPFGSTGLHPFRGRLVGSTR
jgi:hypothetical protein